MAKKNSRVKYKELVSGADLCSECPVCFGQLLPPVFQCFNGHLLCENCIPRLAKCPVCRVGMPKRKRIRNFEIEKVIKLKSHPCPFKENGCKATLKYDALVDHKSDCPFMSVQMCSTLKIHGCANETVPLSDLARHLDQVHKRVNVISCSPDNCFRRGYFTLDSPPFSKTGRFSCFFLSMTHEDRPVFWVFQMTQRKRDLEWRLFVLRGASFVSRCRFTMKILDKDSNPRLTWVGPCLGLEPTKKELEACFAIPYRTIKDFVVKNEDKDSLQVTWGLVIEETKAGQDSAVESPQTQTVASRRSTRSNKRSK